MSKLYLSAGAVNRLREHGMYALWRLVGNDPPVHQVGDQLAVCEPYRMRGGNMIFMADTDERPDRVMWVGAHRMKPSRSRHHVKVTVVQQMEFSKLTPVHALMLGIVEELHGLGADVGVSAKMREVWDKSYAKIGRGADLDPMVEFVVFELIPQRAPEETGLRLEMSGVNQ